MTHWISVYKQLPEPHDDVLVVYFSIERDENKFAICEYTDYAGSRFMDLSTERFTEHVTHWMALPEFPENLDEAIIEILCDKFGRI